MKKFIIFLLLMILSFASNVKAESSGTGDGGIIWDTNSTYGTSGYLYSTVGFNIHIESHTGSYDLYFTSDQVFTTDQVRITRQLILDALSSKGISDPETVLNNMLNSGYYKIIANGKIIIGYKDPNDTSSNPPEPVSAASSGNPTPYLTRESDLNAMVGEHSGWFTQVAVDEMRQRFRQDITNQISPPPPPPPPSTNNINFYLSIEDPDKIDTNDWVRSPVLQTKSKSGYGIPLVAEIRGFNYVPHTTGQNKKSRYTDFRIDKNNSSVYISSTNLDSKILQPSDMKNFDFITSKINGDDEYARYFLKQNSGSPFNLRKLYTAVTQLDGTYNLTVTANIQATWTEWEWETHRDTGYPNYIPIWDWYSYNRSGMYSSSQSVTIDIQGSMFDDDSQTVGQ